LITGTNGQEQAFIKDVHLTKPQQVLVECSAPDNQHSSWKKVDFDQSVVSIKTNSTSFYHNVSSLQATGKFIYSNDNTVFCISYVYPEGKITVSHKVICLLKIVKINFPFFICFICHRLPTAQVYKRATIFIGLS